MTLLERVKSIANGATIIRDWLGEGGTPVPYETAQSRALTCLSCPNNLPGGALSENVAKAIKAHLEVKSKLNLKVSGEKRLAECQICGCQLRLAVWTPIDFIRRHFMAGEAEKYPNFCWKTTEGFKPPT